MMKRLVGSAFALLLCLGLFSATASAEEMAGGAIEGTEISWSPEDTGVLTASDKEFPIGTSILQQQSLNVFVPILDPPVNPFVDVTENDYYYDPVLWAVAMGITTGTSDTTFAPQKTCTRAQMVTFLWRLADQPEPVATENPFSDVAEDAYYYKAVLWAVENNITNGTGEGKFSPNATVTRAQACTFLYRQFGKTATGDMPFADVEAGSYYEDAVRWAYQNGITTGTTETTFSPQEPCKRGQIVTFLYRRCVRVIIF